MLPLARRNIRFIEPAPRSLQAVSSIALRSGTKFVSHMFWPARTSERSPAPVEPIVFADAVFEEVLVLEDELIVVIDLHRERQPVYRRDDGALLAVAVV